ncbi:T9SS type B sorting domain-containing protein [Portibacter lacus]|uniref:PKD domain-containing protein n=1 Tax=Portibacter lacus TaxID=1099794 RepID=A0AA37ST14_9BACT|nr:gliding motility-associated C-terminal domain-containing protein [Portibacter lacus]GLR17643.1 hypothetical protein GCM10007940_22580 [Portibacter lacus]
MYRALLFVLFNIFVLTSWGQSSNVNCASAFEIVNPLAYCSASTEFSTVNAGGSEFETTGCFEGVQNDLWFKFTAVGQAVNIVVNGDNGGSLTRPRVVLLDGSCSDSPLTVLRCVAVDVGDDVANLFKSELVVGATYLIRVGAAGGNVGSFQICVNNYNPPIEPGQDAETAAVLCDKTGFVVQTLSGGGMDADEGAGSCLDVGIGNSENQSSWTTWVAENNGSLTFAITPLNANDDIDFVLYELPNGIDDFSGKTVVRCMASSCIGPTGLRVGSNDVQEDPGCAAGDDNFLSPLVQEAGKAYGLLINNFTETGVGISLDFGGDAEFQGPDPDFSIIVDNVVNPVSGLKCDKLFEVVDNSENVAGNIIKYEWNFGEDAVPQTGEGAGPFDITYLTFGEKFVVLSVTSDLGCKITEVEQITVEPCCDDVEEVTIEIVNQQNVGCIEDQKGSFTIIGSGGFPEYSYNFMGGNYESITTFSDLEIGDYEVGLIDRKGCEVTRTVSIVSATELNVDAGPDDTVEFLGDSYQLNGSHNSTVDVTISWSPADMIVCPDGGNSCLDPTVTVFSETTYTLTVMDSDGCVVSDDVTLDFLNIRPLFAPNIFSPNDDGVNDIFNLAGNAFSVSSILQFNIYDRWGNQVYSGSNLSPQDLNAGWDGTINGELLDPGVYIWYATLEFLDPEVENEVITGDVTLIR